MIRLHQAIFAWLVAAVFFTYMIFTQETDRIRELISSTFGRPQARVVCDPVVIEQDYAVADWIQGNQGGRTLLHKVEGSWQIDLCAGDSLRTPDGLIHAGVPALVATPLAQRLADEERGLSPTLLSRFGSYRPGMDALSHH